MAFITKTILNRWYSPLDKLRILDAGCGTGAAMQSILANYGEVTGFDISIQALRYCRQREIERTACASVLHIPFEPQRFDLISSFDVLSDIGVNNDILAFKEFYRVLDHGGRLIVRLPAYRWLSSRHDDAVQTVRRYHAGQLSALFTEAGFIVELMSYANTLLFPFALLYRLAGKIGRKNTARTSDLSIEFSTINRVLTSILQLEAIPVSRSGLPYGLSIFAVGRKP